MNRTYTCEDVEVTIDGTDYVLNGSIERIVIGTDDDGDELVKDIVCAEALFPVVMTGGEYTCCLSLDSFPVEWKDVLIDAILDQMQSDAEKADERRANR